MVISSGRQPGGDARTDQQFNDCWKGSIPEERAGPRDRYLPSQKIPRRTPTMHRVSTLRSPQVTSKYGMRCGVCARSHPTRDCLGKHYGGRVRTIVRTAREYTTLGTKMIHRKKEKKRMRKKWKKRWSTLQLLSLPFQGGIGRDKHQKQPN